MVMHSLFDDFKIANDVLHISYAPLSKFCSCNRSFQCDNPYLTLTCPTSPGRSFLKFADHLPMEFHITWNESVWRSESWRGSLNTLDDDLICLIINNELRFRAEREDETLEWLRDLPTYKCIVRIGSTSLTYQNQITCSKTCFVWCSGAKDFFKL